MRGIAPALAIAIDEGFTAQNPPIINARLADLFARPAALATTISAEKNRAGARLDPWMTREIGFLINVLEDHQAAIEAAIASLVAAPAQLASEARRLRTMSGIGPALVVVIMVRLPELGQLDAKRIAAFAGLALQTCDIGL